MQQHLSQSRQVMGCLSSYISVCVCTTKCVCCVCRYGLKEFGRDALHPTPTGRGAAGFGPPALAQTPTGPPGASVPQQGSVMMVYGLDLDKVNTDKLFNIFCLYGNVVRVSTPPPYSSPLHNLKVNVTNCQPNNYQLVRAKLVLIFLLD